MSALECAEYNAAIDKQSENEHDLAIWWEAFRAVIGTIALENVPEYTAKESGRISDLALAAYKAKAAELVGKK